MNRIFLSILVLMYCCVSTIPVIGQTQFMETADFSDDCAEIPQFDLTCGLNIISGSVSGEQLAGAVDVADYFSYNLPTDGSIQYIKVRSSNGQPSFRTFLALWGGQGCLGDVLYGNIEDPNAEVFSDIQFNSTLTLRGIDAAFDYSMELFVICTDSCVPTNCDPCQQWNPVACACETAPIPVCNTICEVYNPSTCSCDPIVAPVCNPTCEVYNPSTCSCDPIAAPLCNATCEIYNPSTCNCDPIVAPVCNPTCEVYNPSTCSCDPVVAPVCNPTCEVYNPSTCSCDPVVAPVCNPTCEVYNPSTCSCDPIAAPVCNTTCEVYNPSTCSCDPIVAPVCNSTCEVYNPSTCSCDPVVAPVCNPTCEVYNPSTCSCDPIAAPVCNATCEVYNPSTCSCDPIVAPVCNATCEVYNPSTCSCDPIVAPACNPTCEVYNPSTCSCDPIVAPACNPTCEVYNPSTCSCDPIVAPACNPTCEVYNPSTCSCDPIVAPACNPTCEVYNPSTCSCDPIAAPVCNATCEVYNPSTCSCDPIVAPICDPNCEVYNASTCACDPTPTPSCPDVCEVLDESTCSCIPIPNCGESNSAIHEICDGIDNDGNGLIDDGLDCSACFDFNYKPTNPFCDCTAPEINNIVVSNVRKCTPNNTSSSIDITLYFDHIPSAGLLNFSGDLNFQYAIPANNSSKILVLTDQVIKSDGRPINFLVTYEGQKGCYYVLRDGGLAPTGCDAVIPSPSPETPIDTGDSINEEDPPSEPEIPIDTGSNTDGEDSEECLIQFISFDNINRCSDNGSRYKYSDDNFLANLTVHFENAPTDGVLRVGGVVQQSVIVDHLHSATTHTFNNVRLPADGKEFILDASFSEGDFCSYTQIIPALHITDNNPCKTCNILGTNILNIQCEGDMVYFDLLVTGSETGETYQLNGVTENHTGTYNQLSSFKALKKDILTLEVIDGIDSGCTSVFDLDLTACSNASNRTAIPDSPEESLQANGQRLLQFFPNPVKEELVIDYQFSDARVHQSIDLLVYDMVGVLKIKKAIRENSGRVVLDVQSLENGIHLLVLNKGGLLSTHKFVKEDLK